TQIHQPLPLNHPNNMLSAFITRNNWKTSPFVVSDKEACMKDENYPIPRGPPDWIAGSHHSQNREDAADINEDNARAHFMTGHNDTGVLYADSSYPFHILPSITHDQFLEKLGDVKDANPRASPDVLRKKATGAVLLDTVEERFRTYGLEITTNRGKASYKDKTLPIDEINVGRKSANTVCHVVPGGVQGGTAESKDNNDDTPGGAAASSTVIPNQPPIPTEECLAAMGFKVDFLDAHYGYCDCKDERSPVRESYYNDRFFDLPMSDHIFEETYHAYSDEVDDQSKYKFEIPFYDDEFLTSNDMLILDQYFGQFPHPHYKEGKRRPTRWDLKFKPHKKSTYLSKIRSPKWTVFAQPPGHLIDFGHGGKYVLDDRKYHLFPCHPKETKTIDSQLHKQSMSRYGYLLACQLHLGKEFVPFVFNYAYFCEFLQDYEKAHSRKKPELDFSRLSIRHNENHLFLMDISGVHGGNEIAITAPNPVHQGTHTDGEQMSKIRDNKAFQDGSKFRDTVVHGHMDSILHKRKQGSLRVEGDDEDAYLPLVYVERYLSTEQICGKLIQCNSAQRALKRIVAKKKPLILDELQDVDPEVLNSMQSGLDVGVKLAMAPSIPGAVEPDVVLEAVRRAVDTAGLGVAAMEVDADGTDGAQLPDQDDCSDSTVDVRQFIKAATLSMALISLQDDSSSFKWETDPESKKKPAGQPAAGSLPAGSRSHAMSTRRHMISNAQPIVDSEVFDVSVAVEASLASHNEALDESMERNISAYHQEQDDARALVDHGTSNIAGNSAVYSAEGSGDEGDDSEGLGEEDSYDSEKLREQRGYYGARDATSEFETSEIVRVKTEAGSEEAAYEAFQSLAEERKAFFRIPAVWKKRRVRNLKRRAEVEKKFKECKLLQELERCNSSSDEDSQGDHVRCPQCHTAMWIDLPLQYRSFQEYGTCFICETDRELDEDEDQFACPKCDKRFSPIDEWNEKSIAEKGHCYHCEFLRQIRRGMDARGDDGAPEDGGDDSSDDGDDSGDSDGGEDKKRKARDDSDGGGDKKRKAPRKGGSGGGGKGNDDGAREDEDDDGDKKMPADEDQEEENDEDKEVEEDENEEGEEEIIPSSGK
ncbi:MAG: hypothetical protein SGILL_004238, partial [Bacillariaceae sp.]